MTKSLTTILFDLDGTLIDTSAGIKECIKTTLTELRLPQLSDQEMDLFIGPPLQTSFEKHCFIQDAEAQRAVEIFRYHYAKHEIFNASVYSQIPDLLAQLKQNNYLLGVATNKKEDFAFSILQHFDLLKFFDCVYGSAINRGTKSDIITKCYSQLQQKASDVLYLGDTFADADASLDAGVNFIGVSWGFGISETNYVETNKFKYINKPLDLLSLL